MQSAAAIGGSASEFPALPLQPPRLDLCLCCLPRCKVIPVWNCITYDFPSK